MNTPSVPKTVKGKELLVKKSGNETENTTSLKPLFKVL